MTKGILGLDPNDRPREKLLKKGAGALSGLELLQVVIGSGVKGADVVKISKDIYSLLELHHGKVSIDDLQRIKGVSTASASKIIASLELAGRFVKAGTKINSSEDALLLLADLRYKKQEHFVVLALDGANRLIERRLISVGTLNASIVHPRDVFVDAITDRAASIIVAHNHPSGSLEPSPADIEVTKRLREAGKILGINLLEHIIVTPATTRQLGQKLHCHQRH